MDKRPLIVVSILAVVLLVIGSLSNVVGYQSLKSTVCNSPLFNVRTQRATNQQQNSITSRYLGMEKWNLLQFPIKDNKHNELVKKITEIINKMDAETFKRFKEISIQKLEQDKTIGAMILSEISQAFYQVEGKQEKDVDIGIFENNLLQTDTSFIWTCGGISICYDWSPGCILKSIILKIISFIVDIFQWSTVGWLCYPSNHIPCKGI